MNRTIEISFSLLKWAFGISALLWNIENANSQSDTCKFYFDERLQDTIYTETSNPPVFGEKKEDLFRYLTEKIKVEGKQIEEYFDKVFISVIIGKKGNIIESEIVKGGNADINETIIEQIDKMKEWTPATCENQTVNYRLTIPLYIHFKK